MKRTRFDLLSSSLVVAALVLSPVARADEDVTCTLQRTLKVKVGGAFITLTPGKKVVVKVRSNDWSTVTVDGAAGVTATKILEQTCKPLPPRPAADSKSNKAKPVVEKPARPARTDKPAKTDKPLVDKPLVDKPKDVEAPDTTDNTDNTETNTGTNTGTNTEPTETTAVEPVVTAPRVEPVVAPTTTTTTTTTPTTTTAPSNEATVSPIPAGLTLGVAGAAGAAAVVCGAAAVVNQLALAEGQALLSSSTFAAPADGATVAELQQRVSASFIAVVAAGAAGLVLGGTAVGLSLASQLPTDAPTEP